MERLRGYAASELGGCEAMREIDRGEAMKRVSRRDFATARAPRRAWR